MERLESVLKSCDPSLVEGRQYLKNVRGRGYILDREPQATLSAHTMIGDKEQASKWLEKAAQEHTRFALEFKLNPIYDSLRSDPRFEKLSKV